MESETLKIVQHQVGAHMDKILKLFKPGKKITVLVRSPGFPEQDFCLTDDEDAEVAAMVARRFPSPPGEAQGERP